MIYQSTPNHYLQTYIERGRAYRREYWRTQRKHLLIVLAIIVIGVSYLLATPSLNHTVFVWDDEADYTSSARSDISQDAKGVTWVTEVSGGIDRIDFANGSEHLLSTDFAPTGYDIDNIEAVVHTDSNTWLATAEYVGSHETSNWDKDNQQWQTRYIGVENIIDIGVADDNFFVLTADGQLWDDAAKMLLPIEELLTIESAATTYDLLTTGWLDETAAPTVWLAADNTLWQYQNDRWKQRATFDVASLRFLGQAAGYVWVAAESDEQLIGVPFSRSREDVTLSWSQLGLPAGTQEALDRPRWMVSGGKTNGNILLEEGYSFKTLAALAQRGHTVQPIIGRGRGVFGSGQIIIRDAETGVLYGGSDPRKDGLVAAY